MPRLVRTAIRSGVASKLGDKYWGVQYEDGHSSERGFGPAENATISDPKYCKSPLAMTYRGDIRGRAELSKARLVRIKEIKQYYEE